jgi:hypothetical protein
VYGLLGGGASLSALEERGNIERVAS